MFDAADELSVTVEASQEDVLLVSYQQSDGSLFRGALVKIKSWPCPNVRPVCDALTPTEEGIAVSDEGNFAVGQGSNGLAPVDCLNGSSSPVLETSLKDATVGMSDYAALQYRWSYFQKNVPPLPRRNLPSKREKEKIEQVTKLRPRNFLCARCKFALPGFTQPLTPATAVPTGELSLSVSPNPQAPQDAELEDAACLSPSHNRKRRFPLKRTLSQRTTNGHSEEEAISSQEVGKKKLSMAKRSKAPLDTPDEPAPLLLSPTGEGSLKIKFKLAPPVERKVKRVKMMDPVAEEDEDDFDLQPRLRIDCDDGEEDTGDLGIVEEEPVEKRVVGVEIELPPVVETPPRRKRPARGAGKPAPPEGPVPVSAVKVESVKEEKSGANLPDAPGAAKPVARAVTKCVTKDGRTFAVGDIVWGKIVGYPWWPGVIKHIVVCDDPMLQKSAASPAFADPHEPPILQYQEAQIEWYGQKASISYIEVNQLAHFGQEYAKKYKAKLKAGSYQEAVKLATTALNAVPEEEEQDALSEIISETRERQKTLNSSLPVGSGDVYEFPVTEELHTRRPVASSRF